MDEELSPLLSMHAQKALSPTDWVGPHWFFSLNRLLNKVHEVEYIQKTQRSFGFFPWTWSHHVTRHCLWGVCWPGWAQSHTHLASSEGPVVKWDKHAPTICCKLTGFFPSSLVCPPACLLDCLLIASFLPSLLVSLLASLKSFYFSVSFSISEQCLQRHRSVWNSLCHSGSMFTICP